jgi:hypothetical protein
MRVEAGCQRGPTIWNPPTSRRPQLNSTMAQLNDATAASHA